MCERLQRGTGASRSSDRRRSVLELLLEPAEARQVADGLVGRKAIGKGVAIFCQVDPDCFHADEKTYFRYTRWRATRAVAQLLANLGAIPAILAGPLAGVTLEDTRWARCDIKSVALLANVLLRQEAQDKGGSEAILMRDGRVTEGSSSTVFIVRDGKLVTGQQNFSGAATARLVIEALVQLSVLLAHDRGWALDLSGSQLSSLVGCPLRWFLDHEASAGVPRTTALGFGSVVHVLADHVARGELPPDLDVLEAEVDRVWGELGFEAIWQSRAEREAASAALARFLEWHLGRPERRLVASEHGFEVLLDVGE